MNQWLINSWLHEAKKFIPCLQVVDLAKWLKSSCTSRPDIFITQLSCLQCVDSKYQKFLLRQQFRYLIIDEWHEWVRGQKGKMLNQLTFLQTILLKQSQAVFLLSGTPFVGNMCFDMIETIKSLAISSWCTKWTIRFQNEEAEVEVEPVFCYTDEALQMLINDWETVDPKVKTQMLIPLLLLHTADMIIDGLLIMPNYMRNLVEVLDGEIEQA